MKPTLKITQDSATIQFDAMINRGQAMASFLNRNIFRMYQNAQRERWDTANESQGDKWPDPREPYKSRKRIVYATYDGGGTKTMIATGKLFKSAIGPANGMRKVYSESKLFIATSVKYAEDADRERSFTKWSPSFTAKIRDAIKGFIQFNIRKET